jgi:hypothetical protein
VIPSLLFAWHGTDEFMQMGSSNETLIFSLSVVLLVFELLLRYQSVANADCCRFLARSFDLDVARSV